jgi:hypothetical protein
VTPVIDIKILTARRVERRAEQYGASVALHTADTVITDVLFEVVSHGNSREIL